MADVVFVDQNEAAKLLSLAPATLARWRWAGKGPVYRKFGSAVRYSLADLNLFAEGAK